MNIVVKLFIIIIMEKNNDIKLTSEEESELLEINTYFQNVLIDLGQVHVKKYYHTEEIKNLEKLEDELEKITEEVGIDKLPAIAVRLQRKMAG